MQISSERREQLQRKLTEVFKEEIKTLPKDFQWILTDDLVTAFENRMDVLLKICRKRS